MLVAVRKYVHDRRSGLMKAASFLGAVYLARRYVRKRLEEVKERMEEEREARESLKRRFRQTQENVSYTVLALLPTLAEQILREMDVENLTRELKSRSGRKAIPAAAVEDAERPPSSLASSSVDVMSDVSAYGFSGAHAHIRRESVASTSASWMGVPEQCTAASKRPLAENEPEDASEAEGSSQLSSSFVTNESLNVDQSSASIPSEQAAPEAHGDPALTSGTHAPSPSADAESSSHAVGSSSHTAESSSHQTEFSHMSDSFLSTNMSVPVSEAAQRSKTELWNEVKTLTLTRTLTTLYTTTLLSLLTTVQLTLLARSRYVAAVLAREREERWRESAEADLGLGLGVWGIGSALVRGGMGMMGWGGSAGQGDMEEAMMRMMMGAAELGLEEEWDGMGEEGEEAQWALSEEEEGQYLTMSWWLLHVGWKDVRERVRRGVEEAFEGVSLKTNIAAIDLHRLISDVRRRVEHEVTFEGCDRRVNFLSSLLPPTPEMTQHVLQQGGFASDPYYAYDSSSGPYPTTYHPSPYLDSRASLSSAHSSPSPAPGLLLSPSPPHHHILQRPGRENGFPALLSETREILASSDFAHVLEVCLDRAVEVLFVGLEANIFAPAAAAADGVSEARIRLASLLPGLARWSELALTGLPNELVDGLLDVQDVPALSAITFAKFQEKFR